MGVPQLKKWPRAEPSHPPTSPPTLSCNTQTHCPLLSACSQQPYKDFNPVSTQAEWGSFGPGEPIGAPAPSVKTESQARGGLGPDMGAGDIRAAFTGSFGSGTVLWQRGGVERPVQTRVAEAGPGYAARWPYGWSHTVQSQAPALTVPVSWLPDSQPPHP